jgi:hypothetical protein
VSETIRELRRYAKYGPLGCAAFLPDGRHILAATRPFLGRDSMSEYPGNEPAVLSIEDGRAVRHFAPAPVPVKSLSLSRDGRLALTCARGGALHLWDVATGQPLLQFSRWKHWLLSQCHGFGNKGSWVGALLGTAGQDDLRWLDTAALSPDGRLAAAMVSSLTGDLPAGRVWLTSTGAEFRCYPDRGWRRQWCVAFSPDGRLALFGGGTPGEARGECLWLWDVAEGREGRAFGGQRGEVKSIAFLPDGRSALCGGDDGTLRLWGLGDGRVSRTLEGHEKEVRRVSFLPDGRALSGGEDGTIRLWDVAAGREVARYDTGSDDGAGPLLAVSPDGRHALSTTAEWRASALLRIGE